MSSLFVDLETPRLRLRAPVPEDAAAIFEEYATDPEVTRYLAWKPHESIETVVEFLQVVIDGNRTGPEYTWTLSTLEQRRPIGMIAARTRDHMAEVGYVLGRNYWGRGYMSEATAALTDWILSQPGFRRVWAACDTENTRSARVLEKCHFVQEGVLRRWMIYPNLSPEPRDSRAYSRVR